MQKLGKKFAGNL